MKLGDHFSLWEFTRSNKAARYEIDNTPGDAEVAALVALVGAVLDPLRKAVGKPVRITSGYRSAELNAKLRGSSKSAHTRGEAADFKIDGMTAEEIVRKMLELGLEFRQAIVYSPSRGGHVHVSFVEGANKKDIRRAPASGGYPKWDPEKGPPDLG